MDPRTHASYPSASHVLELLKRVAHGVAIHRAVASRLERTDNPQPALSADAKALIPALTGDGFLLISPFQSDLNKALEGLAQEEELHQELKRTVARRKTIEMQLRNIAQELNKGGLFRGKAKQELSLKGSRLEAQLKQMNQEAVELQDRIGVTDYLLKKVANESVNIPGLSEATWLELDQLCLALTAPGRFLLQALEGLSPAQLTGRSLAHVLTNPSAT